MEIALYKRLGEEQGIRALVDRFYDLMESLPEAKVIRDLHPTDLTSSRQKFFEFLSGWTGGPPLFEQKYGHPRLRMRHMPFSIGAVERDQWMMCMSRALDDCGIPKELADRLIAQFYQIADFMRNREEPPH